jgi:uncharacterized protein
MTAYIVDTDTEWPEAQSIPADRVVAGTPAAQTVVTSRSATGESGLWRVTEGEFTTVHDGYVEFIHILDGEGELVHDDGTAWTLAPGVTITMVDGWRGRWIIRRPVVKAYAILNTAA